jgi:hypothetical protein
MMMHPEIARIVTSDRIEQLRRDGAQHRPTPASAPLDEAAVELRLCRVTDDPALEQLAALDGKQLPNGRFVVVEVNGRIAAALSLSDGASFADPFVHTAHLLPLLQLRAAQINNVGRRRTWAALHLLQHHV